MKNNNNPLLVSMLLSMSNYEEYEITLEDMKYLYDTEVNECQIKVYKYVIECLSNGCTYDEVVEIINKLDFAEYKKLSLEKQMYIQRKIRKDVDTRKFNEKNRGVIK